AFAVAALIEGRGDRRGAHWVRPVPLAAWTVITTGIALGSWWAYYELGWGGWWFWDPVENASFMPWLAATALLHSTIVTGKRDALKSWTILLAILAFSLSLLGTFLVRSGVLTSIHAFAVDPARGVFILAILTAAIGGALTLYAVRAPSLRPGGFFAPVSREGALVLNNLFLAAGCFTVLTGTLYPLLLNVVTGASVSVGPPYYEIVFVPLMVPLLLLVALGMMAPWKRADLAGVLSRLKLLALVSVATWGIAWWWTLQASPLPAFGIALSVWIAGSVILEYGERIRIFRCPLRQSWQRARQLPAASHAMSLAHLGVAVFVAGVTASSAWQTEIIRTMAPGDRQDIAGYTLVFEGAGMVAGPNYDAERGTFVVTADGRHITRLEPERRSYLVQATRTTEAAIHTTLFADLYVVLGDAAGEGAHVVRLYHNPLVPWIWGGALLMAAGGAIGLVRRKTGPP
ncbi:MAG: heme lyase CcmF/NrfE family subunit, partial [Alphaproteobacteria bacterium]|nr:heme lyase CcmF/NrfE family subunit [Alphaproteobacteria bacterium]